MVDNTNSLQSRDKKSSRLRRFASSAESSLLGLDQFGESFTMKLDKGNDVVKTLTGSICSIVLLCVVIAYAYQKTDVWLGRKSVNIVTSRIESFYDSSYVFDHKQGLNMAAAFISYADSKVVLDKSIGEIVFNAYEWGVNADGTYFAGRTPIPTQPCSSEQLGLGDQSQSDFYKIYSQSYGFVETYQDEFQCIDKEAMSIKGDFNSDTARLMNIQLVKCHGHDYCKSPEEITAFLRDKYIIMLSNQIRFDSNKYEERSILKESRVSWLPINTQFQQTIPFAVQKTTASLQDKPLDLDELTVIGDDSLFKFTNLPIRPYEKDYDVQMDITVEMSLDELRVERTGYTILDVLSDVGGIQGILISGFALAIGISNFNHFDNYMATRLYKVSSKQNSEKRVELLQPTRLYNLCEYIQSFLPSRLLCCSKNRRQKALEKARDRMEAEVNIVRIVQASRYFKGALRSLLTPSQRKKIRRQNRYHFVDPDSATDEPKEDCSTDSLTMQSESEDIELRKFSDKATGAKYRNASPPLNQVEPLPSNALEEMEGPSPLQTQADKIVVTQSQMLEQPMDQTLRDEINLTAMDNLKSTLDMKEDQMSDRIQQIEHLNEVFDHEKPLERTQQQSIDEEKRQTNTASNSRQLSITSQTAQLMIDKLKQVPESQRDY